CPSERRSAASKQPERSEDRRGSGRTPGWENARAGKARSASEGEALGKTGHTYGGPKGYGGGKAKSATETEQLQSRSHCHMRSPSLTRSVGRRPILAATFMDA